MHTETLRIYKTGNYKVEIDLVDFDEPADYSEMFEVTGYHQGGVTIRNPVNPRSDRYHQWFTPKQYSLAELSKDYAKAGRDNPSREAYESLQRELGWYLTAGVYGFRVTVKKNGITLADTTAGFGFDYSWQYSEESLEDYVKANFRDVIRENVAEACNEARDALSGLLA